MRSAFSSRLIYLFFYKYLAPFNFCVHHILAPQIFAHPLQFLCNSLFWSIIFSVPAQLIALIKLKGAMIIIGEARYCGTEGLVWVRGWDMHSVVWICFVVWILIHKRCFYYSVIYHKGLFSVS